MPGYGKDEVELTLKGHFLVVKGHKEDITEGESEPDLEDCETNPEEEPEASSEPEQLPIGPEGWMRWGHKFLQQMLPAWDLWNQKSFEVEVPVPPYADTDGPVKAQVQKGLLKVTFQKKHGKEVPVE